MLIAAAPSETATRALLSTCDLSSDDLDAGQIDSFLRCGSAADPGGVIGLEVHGPDGLLRSLAVKDTARGQGCGRALVEAMEREAAHRGVTHLYLLTTTAAGFFRALGYQDVDRAVVPDTIRQTRQFAGLCPGTAQVLMKILAVSGSMTHLDK
jgi:N-acetylglutamate synthase-like GNAT family acetyltransferase